MTFDESNSFVAMKGLDSVGRTFTFVIRARVDCATATSSCAIHDFGVPPYIRHKDLWMEEKVINFVVLNALV